MRKLSGEAWIATALGAAFVALSVWWLLYDNRLPGAGDPGRHLLEAFGLRDDLEGFDLLAPLTWESGTDFNYPPLVRSIGATVALVGLRLYDWGPIALNLIFVPMLVAGCYLTGRLVFNSAAGLLAVIFALGTPMLMQLFHVYLLDAPLAAIVALGLWALLASDDFSDRNLSLLAGALIGLSMLVKTPAPLFLAGPFAVMLARGGYRQRRNLALLATAALVIAAPYYVTHLADYIEASKSAAAATTDPWTREHGWLFEGSARFSFDSLTWYALAAVNTQYLAPLLAFLAVGLVAAATRLRRQRYVPELLAGLAVGYLGMTLLSVHDPRYTLPLLVYAAVIGTGWLTTIDRPALFGLGVAGLAFVVTLNTAAGTFGALGTSKVIVADDDETNLIHPGAVTLVDKRGYVVGEPRHDALWTDLMDAAEDAGVETARIDVLEAPIWGTDRVGFAALAEEYGIRTPETDWTVPDAVDLLVTMWWTSDEFFTQTAGYDHPCGWIEEGVWQVPAESARDEGIQISVLAQLRGEDGRLERWCDFAS